MKLNFNFIQQILSKKSQFTGFFVFLVLLGCQPADISDNSLMQQAQTDVRAANILAAKRLANDELAAALHWMHQAARLGDTTALAHALQLQQRLEGKLATAQWLQKSVAAQQVQLSAVNELQRQQLGFWSEQGQSYTFPAVAAYTSPIGCAVTIQPVASQLAGVQRWRKLHQQWQQHPQLSQLAVCFSALHHLDSTQLNCSEQSQQRISCDYSSLEKLVTTADFSQVLVIAGRGKASYNNGIIQLPDNGSLALLQHEFLHLLGFVDEYTLPLASAEQLCQANRIHPNIVMNNNIDAYLQYWQLQQSDVRLTKVDSCNAAGVQAYRLVSAVNPMQFYEAEMPALYWQLANKVLQQSEQIMPVHYYFAYLARQQQNWPLWQQFMQQASNLGYADAQQALRL